MAAAGLRAHAKGQWVIDIEVAPEIFCPSTCVIKRIMLNKMVFEWNEVKN